MKKIVILAFLLLSVSAFAQHALKLKIIHWNDFHAQNTPMVRKDSLGEKYSIGGFAYFKAVIDSLKRVAVANEHSYLLLDAGDNFQGTAISGFTRGASQIKLMNIIHPDAVTLGNHEFDYGWKNIDSLLRYKAIFTVVDANITQANGKRLTQPYLIKQIGNLKVAIIGLTTDNLPNLTLPEKISGLSISSCEDAVKKYLPEVRKERPNIIIVLSHIGVNADRDLAKKFPEVNIFVGGHSHTPLKEPIKENHSLIVQAGSRGQYVGELDLNIDTEGDSILSYSGKLIETRNDRISPDSAILGQIALMEVPVNARLGQTIGILKKDWHAEPKNVLGSNLAAFEAGIYREDMRVDIGIINYGGLRKSLLAGPITMRDIAEINPFGNEIVTFTMTGAEIESALEWMLAKKGTETCEFSGITCEAVSLMKDKATFRNILLNGKKVDPNRKYIAATNIFVGSHLHSIFGLNEDMHPLTHTGIIDFDLLVDGIRKRKEISGENVEWIKGF